MEESMRPAPGLRLLAIPAAFLAVAAACGEFRERPLPLESGGGAVLLSVEVGTNSGTGEYAIAGRTLQVRVRAREDTGRLTGIGYRVVQSGAVHPLLDSAALHFPPRTDTLHLFLYTIPDTLPNNAQIDVYGIAFGPGQAARVTLPRPVLVLRCPSGAVWC
jgi:hypothetical protein